jgi:hypothetical protein
MPTDDEPSDDDTQQQLNALLKIVKSQAATQKAQSEMLKTLNDWIATQQAGGSSAAPPTVAQNGCSTEFIMETISNSISSEFVYDPDNDNTFEKWFSKYEDLFKDDAKKLDEKTRLRILLRKLGSREYELYRDFICPKEPQENSFDETIQKLKLRFGMKETVFRSRFNCLKIRKKDEEDYFTFVGRINKLVQRIDFKKMTEEDFKCLLYVAGLVSSSDTRLREKLLNMLEMQKLTDSGETSAEEQSTQQQQRKLRTIHELAVESERYQSLKGDSEFVERSKVVNKVSSQSMGYPSKEKPEKNEENQSDTPSSPCWNCGGLHYVQVCPFKEHECSECNNIGHKDGYCGKKIKKTKKQEKFSKSFHANAIYKVNQVSQNRKFLQLEIEFIPVKLQIDTASDITIISHDNWKKIGRPQLFNSNGKIVSASGHDVKCFGFFEGTIKLNNDVITEDVFVTSNKTLNVFGNKLMTKFNLWSKPINDFACNRIAENAREKSPYQKFIPQIRKLQASSEELLKKKQNAKFNRHRGEKSRKLSSGEKVFVKVFKNKTFKWTPGEVIEPIEKAMYVVRVGPRRLVRAHINQIRSDKS